MIIAVNYRTGFIDMVPQACLSTLPSESLSLILRETMRSMRHSTVLVDAMELKAWVSNKLHAPEDFNCMMEGLDEVIYGLRGEGTLFNFGITENVAFRECTVCGAAATKPRKEGESTAYVTLTAPHESASLQAVLDTYDAHHEERKLRREGGCNGDPNMNCSFPCTPRIESVGCVLIVSVRMVKNGQAFGFHKSTYKPETYRPDRNYTVHVHFDPDALYEFGGEKWQLTAITCFSGGNHWSTYAQDTAGRWYDFDDRINGS